MATGTAWQLYISMACFGIELTKSISIELQAANRECREGLSNAVISSLKLFLPWAPSADGLYDCLSCDDWFTNPLLHLSQVVIWSPELFKHYQAKSWRMQPARRGFAEFPTLISRLHNNKELNAWRSSMPKPTCFSLRERDLLSQSKQHSSPQYELYEALLLCSSLWQEKLFSFLGKFLK